MARLKHQNTQLIKERSQLHSRIQQLVEDLNRVQAEMERFTKMSAAANDELAKMKQSTSNFYKLVKMLHKMVNGLLVPGMIVCFDRHVRKATGRSTGKAIIVPAAWVLANGRNHTPKLKSPFRIPRRYRGKVDCYVYRPASKKFLHKKQSGTSSTSGYSNSSAKMGRFLVELENIYKQIQRVFVSGMVVCIDEAVRAPNGKPIPKTIRPPAYWKPLDGINHTPQLSRHPFHNQRKHIRCYQYLPSRKKPSS